MAKLGDYLGQILSEVAIARMQADLEAVRVAELYADHPILRTMPIPHFRLPDVEIDVPVAIQEAEEPPEGGSPRGGVDLEPLRKALENLLKDLSSKHKIRLKVSQRKEVRAEAEKKLAGYGWPKELSIDIERVSTELADTVSEAIDRLLRGGRPPTVVPKEKIKSFKADFASSARQILRDSLKPPPRLNALVTTSEVREAGGEHVVTRLRLKLCEEGLEWTRIETEDGKQVRRLVPE